MGIYDQLFGMKPQQPPSGMGMLSSWASQPLGINSFGGSSLMAPSTAAPPGPVSSDDKSSGPSAWQRIAGIVGDALLTGTGHQAVYGPTALAYAKMQPDALDQQYKRAQIVALQAKPQGPAPTELQRDFDFLNTIDPTGARGSGFLDTKTSAPPIVQHNADGTLSVYPAGMVPRGGGAPTATPDLPAGFTVRSGGAASTAPSPFLTPPKRLAP